MRVYEVKGVDERGKVVTVATTDTASDAVIKMHGSHSAYRRIWVQDETGCDVDILNLITRSNEERSG